jgi:hypothetical protein
MPLLNRLRPHVRRLLRAWRYRAIPRMAYMLGHFRSPTQAVMRWPEGRWLLGPRVCVFVHWDGQGAVKEHVLGYLHSLRKAGLAIMFVSNSGRLRPEALAVLKEVCAAILVRRNIGYDFGAWREGIAQLVLPGREIEMLVLANDSVYGPVTDLGPTLAQIDFDEADVWGLTESWQSRFHLQSYFLAFSPRVLASRGWRDFWRGVRPTPSKHWVIHRYEVGFTQSMIRAGFRCRAVWPYPALVQDVEDGLVSADAEEGVDPGVNRRAHHARRIRHAAVERTPLNPTSDLWRQLLRAGFPFLKRELLRDNPSAVTDVADWRNALAAVGGDPGPIERDMQRTLRNKAP